MPKRLTIEAHLSLKELETRYRKAKDPVARSHWQIVWLLAQGKPTHAVVEATGYSATWVRKIAARYNHYGAEGLGDRRHDNPGGEPLLSEQQQKELWEALQGPAPDGGPWNSRKVAEWMANQIGRQVSDQRGWDYLQRLDVSGQRPRRREVVDK